MVRGGSSVRWAAGLVALAALVGCSDDGGDGAPASTTPAPVTLPPADEVDPGFGYFVLDGEAILLTVRACSLESELDVATGVTTELAIDLDDSISMAVSLTRSSFGGDLPTTTDEVLVAEDEAIILDSTRIDRSGTILDLRAPGSLELLFDVDGSVVSARTPVAPDRIWVVMAQGS